MLYCNNFFVAVGSCGASASIAILLRHEIPCAARQTPMSPVVRDCDKSSIPASVPKLQATTTPTCSKLGQPCSVE